MWIDAYDTLDVRIDCDQAEIKKAFHRKSLIEHPDKAVANCRNSEEQNMRFNLIKDANEILKDEDRRKLYDTFGQDLGAEPPEMEVWNIGLNTLLSPFGGFLLKTFLCRLALWILAFRWVAYLLISGGIVCIILYALNVEIKGVATRSPDALPILVNVGIIDIVVILGWIWPLLADTVGILYLASEVASGLQLLENPSASVIAITLLVSVFVAWLVRGWWFYILASEVVLAIVLLVGVVTACGIVRLWIDQVQANRSEKIKEWRQSMRAERTKLQQEVESLKKQLHKS
jgi:hypothetical protein